MPGVCRNCAVKVHPALGVCPLCGAPISSVDASAQAPYPSAGAPDPSGSRGARARRIVPTLAFWTAFALGALNALTAPGSRWSLIPVGAIASVYLVWTRSRSLPSPRGAYLALLFELVIAAYLGVISFAIESSHWYFAYALPSSVLAGGLALAIIAIRQKKPLKKSYTPYLIQGIAGLACFPLALLGTGPEGAVYGGIIAFMSATALFYLGKSSRRWLKNEVKRKLFL